MLHHVDVCVYLYLYHPHFHFLCKVVGVGGPFRAFFVPPQKKYEINGFLVPAFYSEVILAAIFMWS